MGMGVLDFVGERVDIFAKSFDLLVEDQLVLDGVVLFSEFNQLVLLIESGFDRSFIDGLGNETLSFLLVDTEEAS